VLLNFQAVQWAVFAFEAWSAAFAEGVFLQRRKDAATYLLGFVGTEAVFESGSTLVRVGQLLQLLTNWA
jgi:hypothetical protein